MPQVLCPVLVGRDEEARWLRDFDLLEVKPEVRPKILKHNAARLLGLA